LGNLREREHLDDPGLDERVILKGIIKKWDGYLNWIDLAQERDSWQAYLHAIMNLWVP
jgi:hypothetical protein